MSRRRFQALAALLSVFFWYRTGQAVDTLGRAGRWSFRQGDEVRLRVLGLRDGTLPPAAAELAAFGLLDGACPLAAAAADGGGGGADGGGFGGGGEAPEAAPAAAVRNGSAVVRFGRAAETRGYYLVTSASAAPGRDPVRWVVETSSDNGTTWAAAAASGWQLNVDGTADLFPAAEYPTPAARGARAEVDLTPPWPWALGWVVSEALTAAGYVGAAACGLARRERAVRPMAVALFVVILALAAAQAAGHWAAGRRADALSVLGQAPPLVLLAVGLAAFEARFVAVLLAFGVAQVACYAAARALVYGEAGAALARSAAETQASGLLAVAVAGVVVTARRRIVRRARRLVQADRRRYDAMWERILEDPAARRASADLDREARAVAAGCPPGAAQQRDWRRAGGGGGRGRRQSYNRIFHASAVGLRDEAAAAAEPGRPITCLDQLFVQAMRLEPILLDKVKAWALASRGCFPVVRVGTPPPPRSPSSAAAEAAGRREYVPYERIAGDPELLGRVKWAQVKSVERAIEKAVRAYGQDVSRLVDLCRQTIVFDDMEAILACLRAVAADPDADIVRVKNRLRPGGDAAATAGYRDLALNLRIGTAETRRLGIDTHVCELQLLLRPFAELKSEEGHKRYVQFRNLKAE